MQSQARGKRDAFLQKIAARPLVMGILNITPDSFSDGGLYQRPDAGINRARAMIAEGCDAIDVGAESTRPGAEPVSETEEWTRLEPVIATLGSLAVALSIDTYKASVARKALGLGAVVVNDVWGLQRDAAMADTVAEAEALVVIMHNRAGADETLDIVADMRAFFDRSLAVAAQAGIPSHHIILDIGVAFGKTSRQNLEALRRIGELRDYGLPILVGLSRKRFLGSLTGDGVEATPFGTVAANLMAALAGAAIFRVHDVGAHVAAFRVFDRLNGKAAL